MIHLKTKERFCRAIVWNGTPGAAGEILAATADMVLPMALTRTVEGQILIDLYLDLQEPRRLELNEVVVRGDDGSVGVWRREHMEREFDVLAVPA